MLYAVNPYLCNLGLLHMWIFTITLLSVWTPGGNVERSPPFSDQSMAMFPNHSGILTCISGRRRRLTNAIDILWFISAYIYILYTSCLYYPTASWFIAMTQTYSNQCSRAITFTGLQMLPADVDRVQINSIFVRAGNGVTVQKGGEGNHWAMVSVKSTWAWPLYLYPGSKGVSETRALLGN